MPSFDQYLDEFFSTPRTLEAQLFTPKAKVIEDVCTVNIPALRRRNFDVVPVTLQKMISQFVGNTPASVPMWAVAVAPEHLGSRFPPMGVVSVCQTA